MEAEGVEFCPSTYVGAAEHAEDGLTVHTPEALQAEFDAVVLTGGSETPRDLPVPGRELRGMHFAMDFLRQQNKATHGDRHSKQLSAKGKPVIIISAGVTGPDVEGRPDRGWEWEGG